MIDSYPFFLMKDDSLFRFEIVEGHSHEIITISAHPDDDLKWIEAKKNLEILQVSNKPTLIQIDLGLEEGFAADSEQALQGYILAIEEFNKSLLSPYKDIIQGLIIYRGSVFLEKNCTLSYESILDYIDESFLLIYDQKVIKRLTLATILGSIFHRLIAFIDDNLPCFAIFEEAELLDPLDRAILFSKERFEHIFIICQNKDFQYSTLDLGAGYSTLGFFSSHVEDISSSCELGLLLPQDAILTPSSYEILKITIERFIKEKKVFRLIGETIFNESWNDLGQVIYDPEAIHPMTLRMIKGFVASGGEVSVLR